jgi:uncharacterized membrane protein YbaN (DUF454 family)
MAGWRYPLIVTEPTGPVTAGAPRHTRPVRAIFVVLGTMFLGLGALGLVLPVLPTTPFVLLAAACYLRASERLHRRLVTSRTFGPTIVAWQDHGAIPPRAKAIAIALIILTFGFSILFAVEPPIMRAGLAALGIVLVIWLARRPSPPEGLVAPRRVVE